jgi:O-antigen ligase
MPERGAEAAAAVPFWHVDRDRLAYAADVLVVAIAVTLPWSITATTVAIVLWLIALLPTLDAASVRREVMTVAGGLPLALFALAAAGMLWSEADWGERISALLVFNKLLAIPLLLAQFRRSPRAHWVVLGAFASVLVLLVASFALALTPGLTWRGRHNPGVPVKDYITQSGLFAICIFGLAGHLADRWRRQHPSASVAALVLAGLFLANIAYTVTGRTALVTLAVLLVAFLIRYFGWRGIVGAGMAAVALAGSLWLSSSYLRQRVTDVLAELHAYRQADAPTSVGLRIEYWRKAQLFITEAPIIGHGTGSVRDLYRQAAAEGTGATASVTVNPHNQVLAVAIQLGAVGAAVLLAMWLAHLALFRNAGPFAWLGFVVVLQNVVSAQLNSHLFDFTQGWLYVVGVGVLGAAACSSDGARSCDVAAPRDAASALAEPRP